MFFSFGIYLLNLFFSNFVCFKIRYLSILTLKILCTIIAINSILLFNLDSTYLIVFMLPIYLITKPISYNLVYFSIVGIDIVSDRMLELKL